MRMIAADDEALALEMMAEAIREAYPKAQLYEFRSPSKVLEFARENPPCDIAFLDIRMRGMSGVELARELKKLSKKINIIFVTSYDEFTGDAMDMHASGYIMKPVTVEKVRAEVSDLRYQVSGEVQSSPEKKPLMKIHCFGNFDVFSGDKQLIHFERSRAKEVLAYLVYLRGTSCTVREISSVLFEDDSYDKKKQVYIQKFFFSMQKKMKKYGAENVVEKSYNSLALNTSLVACDYYDYINGSDPESTSFFSGDFMAQYSWAEYVTGYLNLMQDRPSK